MTCIFRVGIAIAVGRLGSGAFADLLRGSLPACLAPVGRPTLAWSHRRGSRHLRRRASAAIASPVAPRGSRGCWRGSRARATTPQRAGEAAWHRRARRQRGAARTLLRVAAAAGILSRHHSSQSTAPMGGGRRGSSFNAAAGAGGRGNARWGNDVAKLLDNLQQQAAQQQQLLHALGAGANAQGGPRRGAQEDASHAPRPRAGGDMRGGGTGADGDGRRDREQSRGGDVRGRPGDWRCSSCNAFPCFARTSACFRCRTPRRDSRAPNLTRGPSAGRRGELSGAAGRDAYLGPIGANGSRPLLGARAGNATKVEPSPSFRVPGASVAAKMEDARRRDGDIDGFQPARRPCAAPAVPAAAAATAVDAQPPVPRVSTRNSWAALTEEEEQEDRLAMDEEDANDGDACMDEVRDDARGDDRNDDDEADEPSEEDLRSAWMELCALLRRLEKSEHPTPPGVLASVKTQRDEAEKRWRAARTPHPLHKRLRWAENELRAAEAKEADHRRELAAHLEQAALRTRELEDRLQVDEARTARKRAALHALHREGAINERPAMEKAARVAIAGIGSDIAPALSAIIEQLGEGQQGLRQDLQLLSTSLGRVEGVLRDATEQEMAHDERQQQRQQQPAVFNISDDGDEMGVDDGGGRGEGGDDSGEGARKSRRVSSEVAAACTTAPRWSKPTANAPWQKKQTSLDAKAEASSFLQAVAAAAGAHSPKSPAETNDLAVAERIAREQALRQQQEALQQQQELLQDAARAHAEEQQRRLREQRRQEELLKHQEAAAKAAAAAAAEEARSREELWANMPPEQREQARRLQEQQAAVGAHIFGSTEAGQIAGLVHQSHVRAVVNDQAAGSGQWDEHEVQHLMGMSPEDFARWDTERQSLM